MICQLRIRLPWWWRLYMEAVRVSFYLGVLGHDADHVAAVAANFVTDHAKFELVQQ